MNDFVLLEVIWTLKTFTTDLQQKKKRENNEQDQKKGVPIPPPSWGQGIKSSKSSQLTYLLSFYFTLLLY